MGALAVGCGCWRGAGLSEGAVVRDAFHEDLDGLSGRLVEMTALVGSAVRRACTALVEADLDLAEQVISGDEEIDILRAGIQESVLDLMARQQPVAGDLRVVVSALRMSADLERMGDLAVHLAQTAQRRHPEPAVPPELQLMVEEMARIAEQLAAKAGQVIATRDIQTGLQLDADDDVMDQLHRDLLGVLLSPQWIHGVDTAVDVTLAGRYLERFADHAVHLADDVVFMVTGEHADQIRGHLTS